jgi:hypothetical protein
MDAFPRTTPIADLFSDKLNSHLTVLRLPAKWPCWMKQ